ncbi:hypothetical protein DFH06DRAFT_1340039 [Mycena polygramma]|nr:hypothetical protein DFH06DRAFT_1340039 [Mycena polygramma]
MPATRHTRREGRGGYNPLALPSLPAVPSLSFFASSTSVSATTTASRSSTFKDADPDTQEADAHKGYSTDTTPFFLRRSAKGRLADDLVQRGLDSSRLLADISNAMKLETVQLVASSCALLFDTVQIVRTNRTQCLQLLERVHQIVRALINLCEDGRRSNGQPGPGVGLAPAMARAIETFAETLITLQALLQAQASAGLFSRILKHAETRDQLKECDEELQHALVVFGVSFSLCLVSEVPAAFGVCYTPPAPITICYHRTNLFIPRSPSSSSIPRPFLHLPPSSSTYPPPSSSALLALPLSSAPSRSLFIFPTMKTELLTHTALGGLRRAAADRHAETLRALGR